MRLAGIGVATLGAWALWQALGLREGPGYAAVGPRVFPIITSIGLILSGLAVAATSGRTNAEPGDDDWRTLAGMAALLAGYVAMFGLLGFPIATAAFVTAGARMLGSRHLGRDVAVGVAVGLGAYLLFTRLLGLDLPAGPLDAPLRALTAR